MFTKRPIWILFLFFIITVAKAQETARTLTFGELTSASISNAQPITNFTFEGRAGDTIYITMLDETNNLDMELTVISPNGSFVGTASESVAILLGPLTLGEDGLYTISAGRSSFSETEGIFSLLVDKTEVREIRLGNTQNDVLSGRGSAHFYQFLGNAGEFFSYEVIGDEMGIVIFTPNGQRFIADGYYDSPFRPIEPLPSSGTYSVMIQTLNNDGSSYTFRLRQIEPVPLISGETIADTMLESQPAIFTFESAAGKTWQITAQLPQGGGGNLEILLLSGRETWERRVAADYGSGPAGNPRIEPFIAPDNATYYVLLGYNDYNGEDNIIPYQITLNPSSIISLAPGQIIKGETGSATGEVTYFYNGKTNEQIQLIINRTSETGEIGIQVLSPLDEVVNFYGRGVHSLSLEAILPVDGQYRIIVRNNAYDDSTLQYTLMIQISE